MPNSKQPKQYPQIRFIELKDLVNKKIHIIGMFYIEHQNPKMIIFYMTEDSNDIFNLELSMFNLFAKTLDENSNKIKKNPEIFIRSSRIISGNSEDDILPEFIN